MVLQFETLENFGRFIKSVESGYYANVSTLTIKGNFRPDELQLAQQTCNATLHISGKYVAMDTNNLVAI